MHLRYFLSIPLLLILTLLFNNTNGIASDITAKCSFSASSGEDTLGNLCDGKHETAWASGGGYGEFVQITLPEGRPAAGIYIMWNAVPEGWKLLESHGGSVWSVVNLMDKESYINAYVPLDPGTTKLRIESDSIKWKMSIAELQVFGAGALPADVQVWQPSPEKADLMVIPAHPDDELIYFGGTLPYYAGELGKHTVVVYMTSSPIIRKFEALDGLWKIGVREYPVFLPLANKYTSTVEDAELAWDGLDNAVSLLVEQIRRFRPDVIVTHDLNGEYGHGAHKLTALATEKAVDASDDSKQYPDSVDQYGVWQVKKCYLHLYEKNKIEMNWEEPLDAFDGKTALQMAKAGYALHISQHFRDRPIVDTGEYDNAAYGLYETTVGPDRLKNDFFENIEDTPTPEPAKTSIAAPVTVTPRATPDETVSPVEEVIPTFSGKISPTGSSWTATVVITLVLLLTVAAVSLHNHQIIKTARHARKMK